MLVRKYAIVLYKFTQIFLIVCNLVRAIKYVSHSVHYNPRIYILLHLYQIGFA